MLGALLLQGKILARLAWMLAAGSRRLLARAQLTIKRFMGFWHARLMGVLSLGDAALKHAVQSIKVRSASVSPSGPGVTQSIVACLHVILEAEVVRVVNLSCACCFAAPAKC